MRGASSLPLWKVEGHTRTDEQKLRRVGPPADWGGVDQSVGQGNSRASRAATFGVSVRKRMAAMLVVVTLRTWDEWLTPHTHLIHTVRIACPI